MSLRGDDNLNPIINLMQAGLDGAVMRQRTISDNIANANTPGYKRKDVNFRQILNKKMTIEGKENSLQLITTHKKHNDLSNRKAKKFKVVTDRNSEYKNDANNVDIDEEMAQMAKNNIYYNTLSQTLSGRFRMLKNVIEKGGK